MAVTSLTELCADCGRETPHDVSVEVRDISRTSNGTRYARQPFRVAVCRRCGVEREERVNAT